MECTSWTNQLNWPLLVLICGLLGGFATSDRSRAFLAHGRASPSCGPWCPFTTPAQLAREHWAYNTSSPARRNCCLVIKLKIHYYIQFDKVIRLNIVVGYLVYLLSREKKHFQSTYQNHLAAIREPAHSTFSQGKIGPNGQTQFNRAYLPMGSYEQDILREAGCQQASSQPISISCIIHRSSLSTHLGLPHFVYFRMVTISTVIRVRICTTIFSLIYRVVSIYTMLLYHIQGLTERGTLCSNNDALAMQQNQA